VRRVRRHGGTAAVMTVAAVSTAAALPMPKK